MKLTLEMPLRGEASSPASVCAVAQAAEAAGFEMLGYTDHPAPSRKWLINGGHPTYDPFAALSFVAAVTDRVRLMTYLAVLPYRNPLLLAKSVATVDRLSGGRFTLVVGSGYLRSEFSALGQAIERRNERLDEAIDVVRTVFLDDDFSYDGSDFGALGVIHEPKPVQLPHPPIWIGGNSRASRLRVARCGAGWAPLMTTEVLARTVRTATMANFGDLERAIDELRTFVVAEGRDPDQIAVHVDGLGSIGASPDAVLEQCALLERIGVTHVLVRPDDVSTSEMVESIGRFGSEVIRTLSIDG